MARDPSGISPATYLKAQLIIPRAIYTDLSTRPRDPSANRGGAGVQIFLLNPGVWLEPPTMNSRALRGQSIMFTSLASSCHCPLLPPCSRNSTTGPFLPSLHPGPVHTGLPIAWPVLAFQSHSAITPLTPAALPCPCPRLSQSSCSRDGALEPQVWVKLEFCQRPTL